VENKASGLKGRDEGAMSGGDWDRRLSARFLTCCYPGPTDRAMEFSHVQRHPRTSPTFNPAVEASSRGFLEPFHMQGQAGSRHHTEQRMVTAPTRFVRIVTHLDLLLVSVTGVDCRIPVSNELRWQSGI